MCDLVLDYNRTIVCKGTGDGRLKLYKKEKGNYKLISNGNIELTHVGGLRHYTLTHVFHDATKKDNGEYVCAVQSDYLRKVFYSQPYTINVIGRSYIYSIHLNLYSYLMHITSRYLFPGLNEIRNYSMHAFLRTFGIDFRLPLNNFLSDFSPTYQPLSFSKVSLNVFQGRGIT